MIARTIKRLKKLMVYAILTAIAIVFAITATAMDFSVTLVLPENQRDNGSSFFDLIVRPGQVQDLMIEVINTEERDINVLVEAVTASTTQGGDINYTTKDGEMDETLKFAFEDMITEPNSPITVPAGERVAIPIRLTVPNEPFEGIILGSISVLQMITEEERVSDATIINEYAYVTAVRLMQNEGAESLPADFALGEIEAELVNFRAAVVVPVRNTEPKLIRGATMHAQIFQSGRINPIFEHTRENVGIAPNSIFPFSFIDEEGYGISSGDYTARITIEYEGENWTFEQDFHISPLAAAAVNDGALNLTGETRPVEYWWDNIPLWVMVSAAAGAVLVLSLIIVAIKNKRENDKRFAMLQERLLMQLNK
jgi:hypothetical protein